MIDFELFKLLLVDSSMGDYRNIVDNIKLYIDKNISADVIIDEYEKNKFNMIIKRGEPKFLVNCHLDTVLPLDGWETNPFEPIIVENKIYGLGTSDTKGNIYSVLKAFESILPDNMMILLSFDEEIGTEVSGVKYFLESDFARQIEYAIVCEPTENELVYKHKGYYSFEIKTFGESGHSSASNLFDNAIVKAAEIIPNLAKNGFNVGKIEGGKGGNIISDECVARVSIRSYEDFNFVMNKLKYIISNKLKINDFIINKRFVGDAFVNPEYQNFPFLGGRDFKEVGFWTEAALFQKKGIKSIVYGAGSIEQAHKKNEFVLIEQIEKAVSFFEDFFRKFK